MYNKTRPVYYSTIDNATRDSLVMSTPLNRESIIELLSTNDKAVIRAIVVLNECQTADERIAESTKYQNGQGFTAAHARMGSSMAKFYQKTGFLTKKQIDYWRMKTPSGRMRIEIYAGQLLSIAEAKQRSMK